MLPSIFPTTFTLEAFNAAFNLFISSPIIAGSTAWFVAIALGAFALSRIIGVFSPRYKADYDSQLDIDD